MCTRPILFHRLNSSGADHTGAALEEQAARAGRGSKAPEPALSARRRPRDHPAVVVMEATAEMVAE